MSNSPRVVAILKNGPLHKQRVQIRPGQRQYLAARPGHPGEFATYFLYGMADGRVFGLVEGLILGAISTVWTVEEIKDAPDEMLWKATRQTHREAMDRKGGLLLYSCIVDSTDRAEHPVETVHTYYTMEGVK